MWGPSAIRLCSISPRNLVLSAYNAAPSIDCWHPGDEAAFLAAAVELPEVGALELPLYADGLHKYDSGWFLDHLASLPQDVEATLTMIPDTMERLARNPAFGLASLDPVGRHDALAAVRRAAAMVRTLNDAAGRPLITAVHVFAAARPDHKRFRQHGQALKASLTEVADYDWHDAQPVLEHCDAAPPAGSRRQAVKGFLPLEVELEALVDAGGPGHTGPFGVTVNWGRSMIETRDASGPLRHARMCSETGLLAGLVASGCASLDTRWGSAWDDCHLPPTPVLPESLLTVEKLTKFLAVSPPGQQPLPYCGVKVSAPAGATVQERLGVVAASLGITSSALPAR